MLFIETPLPAALVELGFMTNDSDARKLNSNYYRDKAAEAIAQGISRLLIIGKNKGGQNVRFLFVIL